MNKPVTLSGDEQRDDKAMNRLIQKALAKRRGIDLDEMDAKARRRGVTDALKQLADEVRAQNTITPE